MRENGIRRDRLPAKVGRDESLAIKVKESHGRIALRVVNAQDLEQMTYRTDQVGGGRQRTAMAGCAMEAAWRGSAGAALTDFSLQRIPGPASSARCGAAHPSAESSFHLLKTLACIA